MSEPYQYRIGDSIRYSQSIQDARKAIVGNFRETGVIGNSCIMKGPTVAGFVHLFSGDPYWVVNKYGVDMYSRLDDDGVVTGDSTDVPPGDSPSIIIKDGPSFKWLETARRYLAGLPPSEGYYTIFDRDGGFIEEHLFDNNGHHYLTFEPFSLENPDHRTYYKVNKAGFPTKQTYDDWDIDKRYREGV